MRNYTNPAPEGAKEEMMEEPEDGTPIADVSALAVSDVFGGVLDQVSTAKKYPRSLAKFRQTLKDLAGATPEIALTMNYRLPRGKEGDGSAKFIEGPSVRLAEAAICAWGNTRSGALVVGADATHVMARGFCHDLENNNFVAFEVKRKILDRSGRRYNEDMITVTGAAASKIVWRNSVFGVIPRSEIEAARIYAKGVAAQTIKSVEQSRADALEWWTKSGGTVSQLCALFNKKGMADFGIEELLNLKSIRTAIEVEGRVTFGELLAQIDVQPTIVVPAGFSADALRTAAVTATDDARKPDQGGAPEAGPVAPKVVDVAATVVPPAAPAPPAPPAVPQEEKPVEVKARGGKKPKGEPIAPPPPAAPAPAPVAAAPPVEREPGADDGDDDVSGLFR